jgi:hypothetical protein
MGSLARAELVAWLREQAFVDESLPLDWAELQHDDDSELVWHDVLSPSVSAES